MARVKGGATAKARHKKVLNKAKGYYGARSKLYICVPGSSATQAPVPGTLDYAHQCGCTSAWLILQPAD